MKKIQAFTLLELLTAICVIILISGMYTSATKQISRKDRIAITLKNINDKISDATAMQKGYNKPVYKWGWQNQTPKIAANDILTNYVLPAFDKSTICTTKNLQCSWGYRSLDGEEYINFKAEDEWAGALVTKNNIHIALRPTESCNPRKKDSLCGVLVVNIDNRTGENRLGYDVFIFGFYADSSFRPYGWNLSKKQIEDGCKQESGGETCAAKIAADGWVLKSIGNDAYPIDFP